MRPVLLCDADDCLFPSESVAFEASCAVTNDLLAAIGSARRFGAEDLRRWAAGRNFRGVALALAAEEGVHLDEDELAARAAEEQRRVTADLARRLVPDPAVLGALEALGRRHDLALVSSSALARLDACLRATGLAGRFPPTARFSAADSLPRPTSKPDPAVYTHALSRLGIGADEALAVEDSLAGVQSAVAAGVPVVANLLFVGPDERADRARDLLAAGAMTTTTSWWEVVELLTRTEEIPVGNVVGQQRIPAPAPQRG